MHRLAHVLKLLDEKSARRPAVLALILFLALCFGIACINKRFFFGEFILPFGDDAANDIIIVMAKRFSLFHGNYSRVGFWHPGPFYFQIEALFETVFFDWLH